MQTPPVPAFTASDAITNSVSGLQRAEQQADKAAGAIAGGINDNTANNILALDQAANSFAANAQVLNVVSQTTRKLIDIFA
jgi:flagellar hook-basal body complex protein FliE